MNTKLLKRVRNYVSALDVPTESRRYYARQWVRSVRSLGDRWLVARPVQRIR